MTIQDMARCVFIGVISALIMHQPGESQVNWRQQASLTTPALSIPFFCTPLHALREERHFALVEGLALPNHRLARSPFQVRSLDPTHASLRSTTSDHDYYSELLREEEWNAQSICRCSTAHHSDIRAVPRANRTL